MENHICKRSCPTLVVDQTRKISGMDREMRDNYGRLKIKVKSIMKAKCESTVFVPRQFSACENTTDKMYN